MDGNLRLHCRGSDGDVLFNGIEEVTFTSAGNGWATGGELGRWNTLDVGTNSGRAGHCRDFSRRHRCDDIGRDAGQEIEKATIRIGEFLFIGSAGLHEALLWPMTAIRRCLTDGRWGQVRQDLPVFACKARRRTSEGGRGSSRTGRAGTAATRTGHRPVPRNTPGKPAPISSAINNQSVESNWWPRRAEFLPCPVLNTEYDWAQQFSYLYSAKSGHFLGVWKQ